MIGGAGVALFSSSGLLSREQFVAELRALLGTDQRIIYTPLGSDTTTSTESSTNGYTVTWDGDISSRLSRLGNGWAQSFNGTSQYGSIPDAAALSFGNGAADSGFSAVCVVNATSAAGMRTFLAKSNTANREYLFGTNGNFLNYGQFDESVPSGPTRGSNATITRGIWQAFGSSYTAATGGATAMNDVTLYANGASIASTAFNDAGYVAMENLAAGVTFGARTAGTAEFYTGSLALAVLVARALTAAEHARIVALSSKYFGLGL